MRTDTAGYSSGIHTDTAGYSYGESAAKWIDIYRIDPGIHGLPSTKDTVRYRRETGEIQGGRWDTPPPKYTHTPQGTRAIIHYTLLCYL